MVLETVIESFIFSGIALFLYLNVFFIIALIIKDNSIMDQAWGTGFILVALIALLTGDTENIWNLRRILVTILVCIWGLRLAIYIYIRNRGKGEDWRYKRGRENWGKWFLPRSYLQVFMLQGILLMPIATSIIIINSVSSTDLTLIDGVGIIIWIIGFIFEAGGDWQLYKFKQNPNNKNKIMTQGLWQYTRHPNYFGEVSMWWGIFLLALVVEFPIGLISIISPVLITLLILKVSGITMLEDKYRDNEEYQEYSKKTNSFFPWFPKKLETIK
ncbi:MAG: DUF1295 domain-containing protein [Promethearchaeota archaeon]